MEVIFSGFKYFAILAVANFANINFNEYFCPVGYLLGYGFVMGCDGGSGG